MFNYNDIKKYIPFHKKVQMYGIKLRYKLTNDQKKRDKYVTEIAGIFQPAAMKYYFNERVL